MVIFVVLCICAVAGIYVILSYVENNRLQKRIYILERRITEKEADKEAVERSMFLIKNRCDELETFIKQKESEIGILTGEREQLWNGNAAMSEVLNSYIRENHEYDEIYEPEAS